MLFVYDVCNIKLQLYAKGLAWSIGGGGALKTRFLFPTYMLNSKNRVFNPYFNRYLRNEKNPFVDNSSAEPTLFSMEKNVVFLNLLSGHFYGQSFIKSVRGAFSDKISSKPLYFAFNFNSSHADADTYLRVFTCVRI